MKAESTISSIFERVYVINLDRRSDRWTQFVRELPSDWPFQTPTRFSATDWRSVSEPDGWLAGGGAWGCYRSHLRIIEDSLNQGVESVLIFEDDAVFGPNFARHANQFLRSLPADWSWVYLGGQHIKRFERLPVRVSDTVYRPHNVNRCHAYGIRGREMLQRIYHHLLDRDSWEPKKHIDHHLGKLHAKIESGLYVPDRWLVGQREGKSNIAGRDYPRRFFRGARSLTEPAVEHPVIAVVAARPDDANAAASLVQTLGFDMGAKGKEEFQPKNSLRMQHEAPGLHHVVSRLVSEPTLELQMTFDERVSHLAGWAWKRGRVLNDAITPIGGMHRDLCLLWREMKAAWPNLKIVVASNSATPSEERDQAVGTRSAAITNLLEETIDVFQLDIALCTTQSENSLSELIQFLCPSGLA